MKELLLSRGFVFIGVGCSCNGNPDVYQIPSIDGYKVEIKGGGDSWWIKQRINRVTWSGIVGGGDIASLELNLTKYFNK